MKSEDAFIRYSLKTGCTFGIRIPGYAVLYLVRVGLQYIFQIVILPKNNDSCK